MLVHKPFDYNTILTNWENDKPSFMLWLEHVCGADPDLLHESDQIIQDDDDLRQWVHFFDGDFDSIKETNSLYKRKK